MAVAPFTPFSYLEFTLLYFVSLTIFAASWDLLYTYSGQLTLGQSLPYGVGAFFSILLTIQFKIPPIAAFALAPLVGCAVGGIAGASTVHLRPAYQAIALFLIAELFYWIFQIEFTEEGISPLGSKISLSLYPSFGEIYAMGIGIFVVSMVAIYLLEHSNFRLKLLAIRDDPLAARVNGINANYYRVVIFFISSFFAGVAGALYGFSNFHADYQIFQIFNSIIPIGIVIVGGPGEVIGSIFGGAVISQVFTVLPIWFNQAITYLVFGLLLVLLLRFYPGGAMGYVLRWLRGRARRVRGN
jgi:branched-chain amino acid transport system permease protein